jgi:hypothetical protein
MGMTARRDADTARRLAVDALEADVLTALNQAIGAFDRLAQLLASEGGPTPVISRQLKLEARFAAHLNDRAIAVLGRARPDDLRRVAAMLHVTGCVQRIGARLDLLAGLAPSLIPILSGDDRLRRTSELEVIATRRWLVRARDAVSAGAALSKWAAMGRGGEPGRSVLALAAAAQATPPPGQAGACALSVLADLLDHISVEASCIATRHGVPRCVPAAQTEVYVSPR